LGRRGSLDDPRGLLALKYFELVAEIQPRAFIFENVPGLLTVNGGSDWFHLLDHARRVTGYQLHFKRINAVTFGIPQIRERLVLVGFKKAVDFSFPSEPTGPGSQSLVRTEAAPSRWALESVEGIANHRIREHGDRVRRRYERTPQGSRDRTDHTDRMHPDRPSGTVLVGSSAGGGRPHIHPYEPRVITVREGARLQSFPDWYEFAGSITNQYRQIGNAVPPLLAYEVGVAVRQALSRS
jgi:DNA (cytosine-5)-methyltransferase 1